MEAVLLAGECCESNRMFCGCCEDNSFVFDILAIATMLCGDIFGDAVIFRFVAASTTMFRCICGEMSVLLFLEPTTL